MNLSLDMSQAQNYTSNSQIARVITENWVKINSYCPNCGNNKLTEFENNKPVADFYCNSCMEQFELKSKDGNKVGEIIPDGAFSTMIERINSNDNPNFFLLNYTKNTWQVNNFLIIPKHYFVSDIIEKRKPLSITARRAGWVGCNINISKVPEIGRIYLVENSKVLDKAKVLVKWNSTEFLKSKNSEAKGWILDIMHCIDKINKIQFSLEDMYKFETTLKLKHPENNHIKDKIRQQLQFLRDKRLIEFTGRGNYKKIQYENL